MYGSSNPGVLESEAPKQPSDQGFILTPGSGVSWSWLESEQKSAEWRPHTYENMTTTVFDPTLHPRHLTGTFAPKHMSEQRVSDLGVCSRARVLPFRVRSQCTPGCDRLSRCARSRVPSTGKYFYRIFGAARFGPVFATCLHLEASSRCAATIVLAGSDTNWVHTPAERRSADITIA